MMSIPDLWSAIFLSIRILIGGMLVLAGVLKIKAGSRWFLARVLAYDLVRGKTARFLAKGLPWLEVVCGLFLITGFLLPLIVGVSFVLLFLFTVAVITAFLRDKKVDCGCFGQRANSKTRPARWRIAYRNLVLMALLLVVQQFDVIETAMDNWLNSWLVFVWMVLLIITIVAHMWTYKRAEKPKHPINATGQFVQSH